MDAKTSGFASPAQGYEDQTIDLNALLIHNPSASYFWRLDSSEMCALGLPRGSLLIVDRSKKPAFNNYVLLRHEDQFYCRLMTKHGGKAVFTNGTTELIPTDETEILGVITASIKIYDFPH